MPPYYKSSQDCYSQEKFGLELMSEIQTIRQKVCSDISQFKFKKQRVQMLSSVEEMPSDVHSIIYWMNRDQRVQDNWAFLFAQRLAMKNKASLRVVFCLPPHFLDATYRHYDFMIKGLEMVESECSELGIPFHLLQGEPNAVLPPFLEEHSVGGLVTDFSPLKICRQWVQDIKDKLPKNVPFCQVDAHSVVPVWEASPKQEYMPPTIRPKLTKKLGEYLTEFPALVPHPYNDGIQPKPVDWSSVDDNLSVDRSVGPVGWAKGGALHGYAMLASFLTHRLKDFASSNYVADKDAQSHLSPWIRFGQVSAARCVLEVQRRAKASEQASVAIFLEQCIIRKELSENFCYYQHNYDNMEGAPQWASKSLDLHRDDKRERIYSLEQLDRAKSHEDIWNVAQVQFLTEGKMHGFLRMYWIKKILEWSPDPETALANAIHLNNRYALDGMCPNTYACCMWGVAGLHDQGFKEREIYGKVRCMNYAGCKKKMNIPGLVSHYPVTDKMPGSESLEKISSGSTKNSRKKASEGKTSAAKRRRR